MPSLYIGDLARQEVEATYRLVVTPAEYGSQCDPSVSLFGQTEGQRHVSRN
jgi:hypothetical protein